MKKLRRHEEIFVAMLKKVLWGRGFTISDYYDLDSYMWGRVLDLAAEQGVLGLLLDILEYLPNERHPDKAQRLWWLAGVNAIEERYERQLKVCAEIARKFSEAGLRMLVLKGIGMSRKYANPRRRECGDIDFYLFGDYDRGNKMLLGDRAEMLSEDKKHAHLFYKGVDLENHRTLIDINSGGSERMNAVLEGLLDGGDVETMYLSGGEKVYVPGSTFNSIFLVRHKQVHIRFNLKFRNFVDWALVLKRGGYDKTLLLETCSNAGLLENGALFGRFCEEFIGLEMEDNPFAEFSVPDADLEKLLRWCVLVPKSPTNYSKYFVIEIIQKIVHFYKVQRRICLVTGEVVILNFIVALTKKIVKYIKKRLYNKNHTF